MSNNLFRILSSFLKIISKESKKVNPVDIQNNMIAILSVSGIHSIYALGTENKEEIKVTNKYKMVNFGNTDFMVVDNKGRHFRVNNSFWYWKWDSVEEWEKIKKDSTLNVKYYGWRSSIFGLFPNIVMSVMSNNKDK